METIHTKSYIGLSGAVALVCVAFAAFSFGLSNLDQIKHPNGVVASITVSGEGEVTAVPDIATVSFTVREDAKTVPEAQKKAETKIAAGLKGLEAIGVNKKDTKTMSYVVNPKYEQQPAATYCNGYICPPGKSVIVGYEVSQSVEVKVRKVEQAGEVIGILGKANITEISGPNFTVDEMDGLKESAKTLAIKKAEAKAQSTAKSLGVKLGSITQFSENDRGGYVPMYYKAEMSSMSGVQGAQDQAVSLPEGENIIKSYVTITYTLK